MVVAGSTLIVALSAAAEPALAANDDDVRQAADDILSRPEYQQARPSLTQRVLEWLSDRLGRLFSGVGPNGGHLIGYVILALALSAAGYFLWRVFPRHRLARPERRAPVAHQTVVRRSRDEWLALAREAESAERWDDAVHARYHALTAGLADRSEVPEAPSTTSGEHVQVFARSESSSPGRVAVFSRITDRFEWIWFGGARAAADDSQALADADRDLLADRR